MAEIEKGAGGDGGTQVQKTHLHSSQEQQRTRAAFSHKVLAKNRLQDFIGKLRRVDAHGVHKTKTVQRLGEKHAETGRKGQKAQQETDLEP